MGAWPERKHQRPHPSVTLQTRRTRPRSWSKISSACVVTATASRASIKVICKRYSVRLFLRAVALKHLQNVCSMTVRRHGQRYTSLVASFIVAYSLRKIVACLRRWINMPSPSQLSLRADLAMIQGRSTRTYALIWDGAPRLQRKVQHHHWQYQRAYPGSKAKSYIVHSNAESKATQFQSHYSSSAERLNM